MHAKIIIYMHYRGTKVTIHSNRSTKTGILVNIQGTYMLEQSKLFIILCHSYF